MSDWPDEQTDDPLSIYRLSETQVEKPMTLAEAGNATTSPTMHEHAPQFPRKNSSNGRRIEKPRLKETGAKSTCTDARLFSPESLSGESKTGVRRKRPSHDLLSAADWGFSLEKIP